MFVVTILAGGEGKRMRSNIPKVLHLINGKPMLLRVIEAAQELKPGKIVVVTGKFHTQIIRTLSQYTDIFGIFFIEQPTPLGTGNAIYHTLGQYTMDDHVLILNGDMPLISSDILDNFIFKASSKKCAILSAILPEPHGYGRIVRTPEGDFEEIVEEKDCSEIQRTICEINTGIYFVRAQVLHAFVPKITNDNVQKEYYLTDIVKLMKLNNPLGKIKAISIEPSENIYIRGVNTPEELEEISAYLLGQSGNIISDEFLPLG